MSETRASTGFLWNHFGRSLDFLLLYIQSIVIARWLGAGVFGTFALLMGIVQLLLVGGSVGLESVAFSRLPVASRMPGSEEESLRALLAVRLIAIASIGLCGYAGLHLLPLQLPQGAVILGFAGVLAWYFALRSLISLLVAYRLARMETKRVALLTISVRAVELGGILFLLQTGGDLRGIILLLCVTAFVYAAALLPSPAVLLGPIPQGLVRGLTAQGSRYWLSNVFEFALGRQADVLLLGAFLVSRELIGQYEAAVGFAQGLNSGLTMGLYGVAASTFASIPDASTGLARKQWEAVARAVTFLVIPVLAFCIVHAHSVIPGIYGEPFSGSVPLFCGAAAIYLCTRLLGGGVAADYLNARSRTDVLITASIVSGIGNVGLALVLIPLFGTAGALIATGVAALTIAAIHARAVRGMLGATLPWRTGILLAFLGTASAFILPDALTGADPLRLVVLFFAYGVVFTALSYLVKPYSMADSEMFREDLPLVSNILSWFSRHPGTFVSAEGRRVELSDRQKWGFAWTPDSNVVADVGSSDQPLTGLLPLKAREVIALDTDRAALGRLRDSAPRLRTVEAAAESIPLHDESVDTVLMLDVLEHTSDPMRALAEVHRILRPDGTLILSVPNKGLFRYFDPQNLGVLIRGGANWRIYHPHYSIQDLRRLFGASFRISRVHYGGSFVYPLTFWLAHVFREHFSFKGSTWLKRIGDWDNDISWGRLSYNVILKAVRV